MIAHLIKSTLLATSRAPFTDEADARMLQHAAESGGAMRLRRGTYTDPAIWSRLSPTERYRLRILAVAETRLAPAVVGYESAAALWGFPHARAWPPQVHLISPPDSHVRTRGDVSVHRQHLDDSEVVEVNGLLVTSPLRTALDLARTRPLLDAVVALDFVLSPTRAPHPLHLSLEQLRGPLERDASGRGNVRALRAVALADPLAANGGESVSRVVIHELGFPAPVLQRRHLDRRDGRYDTDFEWPDLRIIGELDGKPKFLKEEYLRPMTPGEPVHREKVRENALRADGNTVARWGIDDVWNRRNLASILIAAGLQVIRQ